MGNARAWLFRGLIVVALAGLVATWFNSWWRMSIVVLGRNQINIYPTGLRSNLTPEYWTLAHGAADMPAWFTPFAWAFFAALIVGLGLSLLWLKNVRGRLVLAAVGLGYFLTPVIMAVVATLKLGSIDIQLQGEQYYSAGGYYASTIVTGLQPAWYVALGVGAFILLLALLRDKILGMPKATKQAVARPASTLGATG